MPLPSHHTPLTPHPISDSASTFPPSLADSRIGVRPDDFSAAINIARQAGLQIDGLHFYRGTGTNATTAFTEAIDTVLTLAKQLPDWTYLDFGGGFGYPYHHDGVAFDWHQFGAALSDRLSQLDRPIELIIEPGRAAIAGCATLLTQVVSVKWQDDKQIVGVSIPRLPIFLYHRFTVAIEKLWRGKGRKAEGEWQRASKLSSSAQNRYGVGEDH